uniref:NADH dehydrogenase [ubiquinone] 1 beta subcomplex subunit 10 n=1 Tax=Strigamia maritima TaxID=126957 RepID=T1J1T5_STRMM
MEEEEQNGDIGKYDELKFIPNINEPRNPFEKFFFALYNVVDKPIIWFRENVVEPNRPKTVYYHRKFRRVPTIDECPIEENVCYFEANQQFRRDRMVDDEILAILRQRRTDCTYYNRPDHREKCAKIMQDYTEAETNWFIKYGDLGALGNVHTAYMKQKHRLVWERRHGSNREAKPAVKPEDELN